jgi:hypothetical protein
MTAKPVSKLPRSIWTKLVNLAKARGEDPNFILLRFASERLLYRLSISRHASKFVLKGAMLFAAWTDARNAAGPRKGGEAGLVAAGYTRRRSLRLPLSASRGRLRASWRS